MNAEIAWLSSAIPMPDIDSEQAAARRQTQLTKPAGSLGALEALAIRLAGMQSRECPNMERVHISIFAADHGVARENVSAFPQAVTAQMIDNFASGGAAICVLARQFGAHLDIIDLGTVGQVSAKNGVRRERIAASTANFIEAPAMDLQQLGAALDAGRHAAQRATDDGAELLILGEMGIANTTSATALACALLQRSPLELTGPGTGLDAAGVQHKAAIIGRALKLHEEALDQPIEILRHLGGFEIAALVGAMIAAAQRRLPILVDGFITSVAALCAIRMAPDTGRWLLFSHQSAEPGHQAVLEALKARPLLALGLRLGEGSGAAIALPLLQAACVLHAEMATFEHAGVSEQEVSTAL
tara:strand:- start:27789 stop:28862 length:1074 start_codon:yes stop_codon:yes gene_type:complete